MFIFQPADVKEVCNSMGGNAESALTSFDHLGVRGFHCTLEEIFGFMQKSCITVRMTAIMPAAFSTYVSSNGYSPQQMHFPFHKTFTLSKSY